MNILDASTLINLINGNALNLVLQLNGLEFGAGTIVIGECGATDETLSNAITAGQIQRLEAEAVPALSFLALMEEQDLGPGEAECLAIALSNPATRICCDDGAARVVIAQLLGPERLSGSLGLLRSLVQQELATPLEAFALYEQMRARGGFLPVVTQDFFG